MVNANPQRLGWFMLAVTLFPSGVGAQTVARSFETLQGILKAGEIVVVTEKTGQETRGRVAEVSTSSLVLVIPEKTGGLEIWTGRRAFAADGVAEILRSDPSGMKGRQVYLALRGSLQDLQQTLKVEIGRAHV